MPRSRKSATEAKTSTPQSAALDAPIYFANHFRVSIAPNDATLVFEVRVLASDGTPVTKTQAFVVMTHQGMKVLSRSLVQVIEHFEKARSPIPLPDGTIPAVKEVKTKGLS